MFLLDVYDKAELHPDASSKGKLLTLLRSFPAGEPTRKKFIAEMMKWSSKFGDFPAGDPELHHVAGTLYAAGKADRIQRQASTSVTEHGHRWRNI
jgi:golgi to ER traffic protein 4